MFLTLLLACSTPEAPPVVTPTNPPVAAPRVVKLALNWYPEPEFGGFYDALVTGKYKEKGLDVTILPGGPGAPTLELLASKQADVAITGADDLLVRRAKGLDAVAIFPGFQDYPGGLLVHKGGPASFADVRGQVAMEQGSPFQQFLAQKYGWAGKVTIVPNTGSLGPFAADPKAIQQAYITSEPCQAAAQNIEVDFLPGRDAGWNPYASLAAVRLEDTDQRWAKDFRDASLAGWNAYLANPAAANAEILKLNPSMAASFMDCVVERQKSFVSGTDGVGAMTETRWNEVAAALNSVGTTVDIHGAWKLIP